MLERDIEAKLARKIKERGGLSYKFTSPGNPGVPDRIVITPYGRVVFVELKTKVGRLSRIQQWQRTELKKRGADVRVLRGWDEAEEFLEELMPNGIQTA